MKIFKIIAKLNREEARYVEDVSDAVEAELHKDSKDWIVSSSPADGRIKVSNRKTRASFNITLVRDYFMVAVTKPKSGVLAKVKNITFHIEKELLKPILWAQKEIEKQLQLKEMKKNPNKFFEDPLADRRSLIRFTI